MPSEEEMKEMQEKLQNMSPEELQEYQKENCIFCQIISGKVASKKVYEDEKCFAILDINPANPGHVLLLPKEHYAIMPLIPEDIIKHVFMISKQISGALLKALQAQGTTIFVANGAVAGQKAQHFMVHIIPRMEKDGVGIGIKGEIANEKELEQIRKVLVAKINKDFGIESEEPEPEPLVAAPELAEAPEPEKEEKPKKKAKKETKEKKPAKKKTTKKKAEPKVSEPEKEAPKEESKDEVSLDDISNLITGGR